MDDFDYLIKVVFCVIKCDAGFSRLRFDKLHRTEIANSAINLFDIKFLKEFVGLPDLFSEQIMNGFRHIASAVLVNKLVQDSEAVNSLANSNFLDPHNRDLSI